MLDLKLLCHRYMLRIQISLSQDLVVSSQVQLPSAGSTNAIDVSVASVLLNS